MEEILEPREDTQTSGWDKARVPAERVEREKHQMQHESNRVNHASLRSKPTATSRLISLRAGRQKLRVGDLLIAPPSQYLF